ncbi:cytochrome c [Methyloligella sp. 2.7D]|uniref:c-type cytochrome n=1 Tax=unclassified Methyloligella TaxID=2625955 RepID=UPI00157D47BC|nr:cytochrome c [Methyloligella sp. GL2]QKP77340.1 cytochrome c [Methyloligella sp. GL2]
MRLGFILTVLTLFCPGLAHADEAAVARGQAFVESHCARCHAIGPEGESPMAEAPPFRTLKQHYPVDSLAEALAEGIVTGHPDMPPFELDPHQINDIILYLDTL